MIARPAFWGRVVARGTFRGDNISGTGFVERCASSATTPCPRSLGRLQSDATIGAEYFAADLDRTSAAALAGGERHIEGIELDRLRRWSSRSHDRRPRWQGVALVRRVGVLRCRAAIRKCGRLASAAELAHAGSPMVDDIETTCGSSRVLPRTRCTARADHQRGTACYFLPHLLCGARPRRFAQAAYLINTRSDARRMPVFRR